MFNQALFHVLKYPAWISAEATPQSREAFMMQTTAGRDMTKKETYLNHNRHDDDSQKDNDSNNYPNTHLHILPPHFLADTVCTTTETLGGNSQVVYPSIKSAFHSCKTAL
jgi:hypothetical protein